MQAFSHNQTGTLLIGHLHIFFLPLTRLEREEELFVTSQDFYDSKDGRLSSTNGPR